jgi:hypothetical protein
MDILLIILGIFLHFFALPLTVIGLIWFFFVGRRLYKEKKSLEAFKGNEMAKAMTRDRIKASFLRALGIVLWPVLMLALLFLLMDVLGQAALYIAFMASTVVSGFFFAWAAGIKGRYNLSFKENIVKVELAKVFDDLNYDPQGAFDPESIRNLEFFSSFDGFTGNDLIIADYQGLHFAQCDMGVKERYTVTVTDKNGHTSIEERWRDVFKGRAMRFDFADAFRGRVQVVSRNFDGSRVKQSRGGWQTVETELAEFGKYFDVYAPDPLDAMAALTPQMIEGIFYLKKALDVPTALYFTGNTMTVFMALEREAFDVSGNTLLEETRLLERDIALMTGFMDVMYFKRPVTNEDTRRSEAGRSETAAIVAAAVGPSGAEKLARQTGRQARRGLGMALAFLPKLIIAVYLVSAVYGFTKLPSELAAGITLGGDWTAPPDAMQVPTIGFLVVAGVFIIISALGRHYVFSIICLAIYLLFMAANL